MADLSEIKRLGTNQTSILQIALFEFIENRKASTIFTTRLEAKVADELRDFLRDCAEKEIAVIPAQTLY